MKAKKSTKTILLGGAIGVLSVASLATASAHFGGNSEQRDAVNAALESNDYAAFQELTKDSKRGEEITSQEAFNKLAQAHALQVSGDAEGAKALREELGIKGHGGRGGADRNPETHEAVTNDDFAAFQSATAGKEIGESIDTQAKFDQLVQANALRKAGSHDESKAIMDELGLKRGGHHGDRNGSKDN